ncbi:hypothetical protein AAG906_004288 [Vitis piasezkii]
MGSQVEPSLTIQSFHQCTNLISIKLNISNYLLWRSQVLPLVRSLGLLHHITNAGKPLELINNDGLLTSWLLGVITEEVLSLIVGIEFAYNTWKSLEDQLLPKTKQQEFKRICDNLAAINKPISDLDKVFQFARGLGPKYQDFRVAMLTNPPYPTFSQFVMALQKDLPQALAAINNMNEEVDRNFMLILLQDVLVVPNLKKNLLSVGQLIDDYECTFKFSSSGFVIKDRNKKILAMGRKKGQLYALDRERHKALSVEKISKASSKIWHQRMGHPHSRILKVLQNKNSSWTNMFNVCASCQMGKSCKIPFGLS